MHQVALAFALALVESVRGDVHTNGMEALWSTINRVHKGTSHKWSPKHLARYVTEFSARHNWREMDTIAIMGATLLGMVGKRLTYETLIEGNGLANGART